MMCRCAGCWQVEVGQEVVDVAQLACLRPKLPVQGR